MPASAQTPSDSGVDSPERLEALVRAEYERCCANDTFDDLKRRARFSKEDKYLLRDWMKAAAPSGSGARVAPAEPPVPGMARMTRWAPDPQTAAE